MTYALKATVLAPTGGTVDLSSTSAHRGSAWKTEKRDLKGMWTHTGGKLTGKHAPYMDPDRQIADSYHGVTVKDDASFSKIDWDGLMQLAADPHATPTERERAMKRVTLHMEQMKRRVEKITPTSHSTVTTSSSTTTLKVKEAVAPVVPAAKKTESFAKDTASDASRVALTQQVLAYAVRAAGAAAVLVGAHESEHFVEAFKAISENPGVESAVNVALTLLITALIARIQKAFRERHDAKVAKARGEIS